MIYLVSGEPYQAEQCIKELKGKKIEEGFEYYSFDAEENVEESISTLLDSPSLFNKNKIILARISDYVFFETFVEARKNGIRTPPSARTFLTSSVGEDVVIFFAPSLKKISLKLSASHVSLRHFIMPKGEILKEFIVKECNNRGMKLNNETLNRFLLGERSLTDLFCIVNEIEKIYLAPAHYQEIETFAKIENPFELTNALSRRGKADLLKLFEYEFQNGSKPIDMMSRILWQLRVLIIVAAYNSQPTTLNLQFHPFVIQKARQALRLFSLLELKELYINAISLYEQLIFSSLPSQLLLSRLFWRF